MRDLIGIPEVARMMGRSRQWAWLLYKNGKLQAVAMSGTDIRPRPLFSRSYIETLVKTETEKAAA